MTIDKATRQIFMVGSGGQGLLVLARALAEAALRAGVDVIASETHGMAMRGGTVTASLKCGPFASPLIPSGAADLLIGLDETEAGKFLHMLSPRGVMVTNSRCPESGTHTIDATGLALAHGMPQAANMIMLGRVLRLMGCTLEESRGIGDSVSPERFRALNLCALELGYAHAT